MNRSLAHRASARSYGFTLVELLIVIAIIGILAGLTIGGVLAIKARVRESQAQSDVTTFVTALENYRSDIGDYPSSDSEEAPDEDTNEFPALYNAMVRADEEDNTLAEPFFQFEEQRVVVEDEEMSTEDNLVYRKATKSERDDPEVDKYYLDPFNRPYVYRKNRGWEAAFFMKNSRKFDIYSTGENGIDETKLGEDGEDDSDDIGNGWRP